MKYSYELADFLEKINIQNKKELLEVLSELNYADYMGFSRKWISNLIMQVSSIPDDTFLYLIKSDK